MNRFKVKFKVFFNASVILSGFRSPKGGSAKLIKFVKQKKIIGIINEIVINEVLRNIHKTSFEVDEAKKIITKSFLIISAPDEIFFSYYRKILLDEGDIHLFTSSKQIKADFLVSLDKKHVLSLQNKINEFKIVSPKELIEFLKYGNDRNGRQL